MTRKPKRTPHNRAVQLRQWKHTTGARHAHQFVDEMTGIIAEFVEKTKAQFEPEPDPTHDRIVRHAWAMMGMLIEQKKLDPWRLGDVMGDKDKIAIFDDIQDWIDSLYLSLVGIGLEWHD